MISKKLIPLVLLLVVAAPLNGQNAPADSQAATPVEVPKPGVDVATKCPQLRIAVVNGVSFHFEVLAGLLHVLRPYENILDVFLGPFVRSQNYDGAWDFVKWSQARFLKTDQSVRRMNVTYDLVILVSPDYEVKTNHNLLKQMDAKLVIAIVHNADFEQMPELLALSPHLELLTLSPHVAESLAQATGRSTDWMLASYPAGMPLEQISPPGGKGTYAYSKDGCQGVSGEPLIGSCLRGFAMQGKFSNLRRNYSSIWEQMKARSVDLQDPMVGRLFHLNVLGKGPDRLNLPPELMLAVSVHRRLQYRSFYDLIGRTLALVPSLASPRYFTHKFSSTIITSLTTGTPVIADSRLLASYRFLPDDVIFKQGDDEGEVDVMLRISRMKAPEILKPRVAIHRLRDELNERSRKMLDGYIGRVCGGSGGAAAAAAGGHRRLRVRERLRAAGGLEPGQNMHGRLHQGPG